MLLLHVVLKNKVWLLAIVLYAFLFPNTVSFLKIGTLNENSPKMVPVSFYNAEQYPKQSDVMTDSVAADETAAEV